MRWVPLHDLGPDVLAALRRKFDDDSANPGFEANPDGLGAGDRVSGQGPPFSGPVREETEGPIGVDWDHPGLDYRANAMRCRHDLPASLLAASSKLSRTCSH